VIRRILIVSPVDPMGSPRELLGVNMSGIDARLT